MPGEDRTCKDCGESKPLEDFEATLRDKATGAVKSRRAVCKRCYQRSKNAKAKAKNSEIDPALIPKPESCVKCGRGTPDVDFKWRTDVARGSWRNECNTCYNAKNYSATSRAKRKEENPVEYLKRNAEQHRVWAHNNADKVKRQQELQLTDPERRIKMVATQARSRGIEFVMDDMPAMMAKLLEPCLYCGREVTPGERLHGLDRVDNERGFCDDNTVPCCGACNRMKAVHSVDVFIGLVRAIVAHCGLHDMCDTIPRPNIVFGGTKALRDAPDKVKDRNELPEHVQMDMWCGACYLCGRLPALGIDRVDASLGYLGNSRSCCTDCNYLKNCVVLEELQAHLSYVHRHTRFWVLSDILDEPLKTSTGDVRQPVMAEDGNGSRLIFPSIVTAADLATIARTTLQSAIECGRPVRGTHWTRVTPGEYRMQSIESQSAQEFLGYLRSLA
jgi:hypothetical protein